MAALGRLRDRCGVRAESWLRHCIVTTGCAVLLICWRISRITLVSRAGLESGSNRQEPGLRGFMFRWILRVSVR
jgi:hypothetical protein